MRMQKQSSVTLFVVFGRNTPPRILDFRRRKNICARGIGELPFFFFSERKSRNVRAVHREPETRVDDGKIPHSSRLSCDLPIHFPLRARKTFDDIRFMGSCSSRQHPSVISRWYAELHQSFPNETYRHRQRLFTGQWHGYENTNRGKYDGIVDEK